MSPAVMSGLPAELLFLICDAADRSDLYSIALTSRILNEAATPALYSVIDLQLFHAIYACARALASPASKTSLNRDLAGFVESISLRHPNRSATTWTLKDKELGVIKRRLAHAIPRMWRLQSFTCRIAGLYHMGETFTTLASGSLPLVHTIDIDVQLPFSDDVMVTPFAVTTRGLKTLKLRNGTNFFSAAYSAFLCSLLEASRHTLQSLSLSHKADVALQSAFRSSFPVLWELDVPIGILSEPAFLDTSGIRHLVISKFWEALEIDPALLPNLEEVTCFSHQLATFLPEQAQHRRPIRTITLDRAEYGLPRLHFLSGDLGMQVWRVANDPAMRSLQFSAAPLVRLSFLVSELSVPYLEDLLPIFQELQYLYISLQVKRGEVRAVVLCSLRMLRFVLSVVSVFRIDTATTKLRRWLRC